MIEVADGFLLAELTLPWFLFMLYKLFLLLKILGEFLAVLTAVLAEVVLAPPGPDALASLTMTPFELILLFIF